MQVVVYSRFWHLEYLNISLSVEVFWIKIFKMNELRLWEKKSQSTLTVILKWNEANVIIEIIRHLHKRDDFTGIYVCIWKGVESNSTQPNVWAYGAMEQVHDSMTNHELEFMDTKRYILLSREA